MELATEDASVQLSETQAVPPAAEHADISRQDETATAGSSTAPTGQSEKELEQAPAPSESPEGGVEEQLEMDAPLIGARLQIWWPLDEAWWLLQFSRVPA